MDNFPKCQICHKHFTLKSPAPRLLPCLHAVCETCVTYVTFETRAGGVISCSTCQREVNLTETHLQKDVVRQREIFHLTVQHRPSELLCTHEDDGNQAVCWCQECEEFLCENCQTLHESFKLTRNHTIQDIGEIQPGRLANEEYCRTHKKYPLDLWDRSCNILICGRCRRGDHAEHDVEDVDEAADSTRTEMEVQAKEVQSVAVNHNSILEKAREHLRCMEESSSCLMDSIGHTFGSLRSLLNQREKELLTARQQDIDQTKDHLNMTSTTSELGHLKCTMTTDYINKALLYSSKYDLLSLRQTIRDTSQFCISSSLTAKTDDHPLPIFSTEGLDELKITIAVFGDEASQRPSMNRNVISQETGIQTEMIEQEKEADKFNQEDCHLKCRISELETSAAALRREKSMLQTEIEQRTKEAATFNQEVYHLKYRISELETSDAVLRREKSKLQTETEQRTKEAATFNQEVYHLKYRISELETSDAVLRREKSKLQTETEQRTKEAATFNQEVYHLKYRISELETSDAVLRREKSKLQTETEQRTKANAELERRIEESDKTHKRLHASLVNIGLAPEANFHLLKTSEGDKSVILQCIHLTLDRDRVNTEEVGIDEAGDLVNETQFTIPEQGKRRLKKYHGTTSTHPLHRCGSPQYWEVKIRVGTDKPLEKNYLLLEIGLCIEEEQDQHHCVGGRPHSYALNVGHCETHNSVCRNVWGHGGNVLCLPYTLPNGPRQSATLHYGVVYDDFRNKVAFLDIAEKKLISKIDNVNCGKPLWPIFGVYNRAHASVSMSLIVDHNINMWEGKNVLIQKSLL